VSVDERYHYNSTLSSAAAAAASLNIQHRLITTSLVGLHGSEVERQSLASILSPSCARPVADG